MSQAFSGWGLTVSIGTIASPPVFTAISEVQVVDFSNDKVDLVDVTHTQSPNARREFLATLIDDGEMNFTANFIPGDATQTNLQTVRAARTATPWEVVLPGSLGTFTFAGIITALNHNLDFSKESKLTVKVKVTGELLFTT